MLFTALALLLISATSAEQPLPAGSFNLVGALQSFRAGTLDEAGLLRAAREELLALSVPGYGEVAAAASNYLAAAKSLATLRPPSIADAARSLGLGPHSDRADPWAGPEQEPAWCPDWTEVAITNLPGVSKPLPAGVVGAWIPSRYRLAELLGLGTNHVHAAVLLVDPAFETGTNPRYFVESLIRFSLVGTFQPAAVLGPDGNFHPANPPVIETFRRELDSRRRVIHLRIHAGLNVRPERTGELDHGFEEMDKGRYGGWLNDRLADRLAEHSWVRDRSEAQRKREAATEDELAAALAGRLHAWREASRAEHLKLADASGLSRRLRHHWAELRAAEQGPAASRAPDLLPRFSERLPEVAALAEPQDFALITRSVRQTELHALLHAIEPVQRERAALIVVAVAQALAERTTPTTNER